MEGFLILVYAIAEQSIISHFVASAIRSAEATKCAAMAVVTRCFPERSNRRLKKIHQELRIQITQERMWPILSQYGDVSRFHAGVFKSYEVDGSDNKASLGCERVCEIVDMGLNITLKERIVDFVEGESYKYEVYEWKNFPIRKMLFGFRIVHSTPAYIVLGIDIEYKARPAFLTPLLAGKMANLARDVLLGYKHYAETGEHRTPINALRAKYKSLPYAEVQYG